MPGPCSRLVLLLVFLLSACAPPDDAPSAAAPADTLRIDGSTGVRPLVAALAEAFEEQHPSTTVVIGDGLDPEARIAALADGRIDLAMASHGLDAPAIEAQGMTVHRFAEMAVVFGVHAGVPVENLTSEQLCAIYTGALVNWAEVGGPELPIVPLSRPESEVDTEVARAEIGCFGELEMAPGVRFEAKSGDMARALASTPGAVGMTTMVRVEQSGRAIRALALDGVAPTPANLESGRYRLSRDSFLVAPAEPSAAAERFLTFLRMDEAREILRANSAAPAG